MALSTSPHTQELPALPHRAPSPQLVTSVKGEGRLAGHTHQLSHQVKMLLSFFWAKKSPFKELLSSHLYPSPAPQVLPCIIDLQLWLTPHLGAQGSNAISMVMWSSWRLHFQDSFIPPNCPPRSSKLISQSPVPRKEHVLPCAPAHPDSGRREGWTEVPARTPPGPPGEVFPDVSPPAPPPSNKGTVKFGKGHLPLECETLKTECKPPSSFQVNKGDSVHVPPLCTHMHTCTLAGTHPPLPAGCGSCRTRRDPLWGGLPSGGTERPRPRAQHPGRSRAARPPGHQLQATLRVMHHPPASSPLFPTQGKDQTGKATHQR